MMSEGTLWLFRACAGTQNLQQLCVRRECLIEQCLARPGILLRRLRSQRKQGGAHLVGDLCRQFALIGYAMFFSS